jgi:two-component system CheB/CheR fusion protein
MDELRNYKDRTERRLLGLRQIFANVTLGDFSVDVPTYEEEDEFTEVYEGVQIMLEVIRGNLDELQELNTALAQKVEELKEEIVLREVLEKRKDEFISLLGHELRNPLAPIMYATEIIKLNLSEEERTKQEIAQSLEMIERQGTHMTRLVHDLLDVSRILHQKIELKKEHVDIGEIVEHALNTVKPAADEKRHELIVEFPSSELFICADPMRIEQILINLLNNAVRYTPPSGVIEVRVLVRDNFVDVLVRDNGIGIAPDFLDKIFEIFVQSEAAKQNQGGLGMGLMVARGLAQLHDGDVTVRSGGTGLGSEFTLTLPLAVGAVTQTQTEGQPSSLSAAKKKILIVDDNADLADSMGLMLRSAGYEVEIAYNGQQALERIPSLQPDVIFLDLAMPVMDGYEVVKKIRNEQSVPGVRVIALTGFGQASDFMHTKEAGFDGHLVKPANIQDLFQVLQ